MIKASWMCFSHFCLLTTKTTMQFWWLFCFLLAAILEKKQKHRSENKSRYFHNHNYVPHNYQTGSRPHATGLWHSGQKLCLRISFSSAQCLHTLHIQNWYSWIGRPVTMHMGNFPSDLKVRKTNKKKETEISCQKIFRHNKTRKKIEVKGFREQ